jgi:hypothetical protein
MRISYAGAEFVIETLIQLWRTLSPFTHLLEASTPSHNASLPPLNEVLVVLETTLPVSYPTEKCVKSKVKLLCLELQLTGGVPSSCFCPIQYVNASAVHKFAVADHTSRLPKHLTLVFDDYKHIHRT